MKKIGAMLVVAMAVAACATVSPYYRQGARAELNSDFDSAIQSYEKAMAQDPKEPVYRLALARAKGSAALFHLRQARALAAHGKKKEALAEYAMVLSYEPQNGVAAAEVRALEAPAPKPVKPAGVVPESPVKLKTSGEKLNINFRTPVSLKSILDTLARTSGVTFIYDETYRDMNLAVDLTGKDLEQAVNYLCVASKNFSRVVDDKTVIIAPDNFTMRQKYELLVIRTFYLSNINAQDVQLALVNMIKTQTKIPTVQVDKNLNSITIRDTPQAVAQAERLLRAWDKAQPEVLIDVEIMEVERSLLRQLGIDFSKTALSVELNPEISPGSDSGWVNLSGLKLGRLSSYQFTNPAAALQFLEGDSHTKIIAQPKIRGVTGEDMKYLVGDKVPILTASYTPITGGTTTSQAITQFTQQDVGIDLKLKPRIHLEREVTIEAEIKVSAISGYNSYGYPTIATREIKNTIRLKDGETSLLAGLLKDQEQKQVTGITGLKSLPIIGSIFSYTRTMIDQTDLILTITPHIIRPLALSEEDAKPVWVDPNNIRTGLPSGQAAGVEQMVEQAALAENQPEEPGEEAANALYLTPASFEIPKDREFRVNVELASEKEIGVMTINIGFNPQVVKLKEVVEGGIAKQMGGQARFTSYSSESSCTLGVTGPMGQGFKGQGIVAALVFTAAGPGETAVTIGSYSAYGTTGQSIVLSTGDSKILIR
ncbi:MAG TPA: secretin N-terminal domain-containing protein [Terriglobales bacterium]|nr:secretin N-terminal domain-containing protein [Terriglobales bacterium]